MKKVELHLHLDGSVRVNTVAEILNKPIEECYLNMVSTNSKSLTEYLTKFDYPVKAMQTKENLIRITKELIEDLIKDDVCYAEIRFAPILHTTKISLEEVVESVLEGIKSDKIIVNVILCMMRNCSYNENIKIIDLCKKYKNRGVVGLDLAGDEYNYPNELFSGLFLEARKQNISYTIHSGEALDYGSVVKALDLKALRIGHGITSINSLKLIKRLIDDKILLEICPTSNVDTLAIIDYQKHPIKKLYDMGVGVSISTDNRTVSNITLEEEYKRLKYFLGFNDEDLKQININSIKYSFASLKQKEEILKKLS